MLIFCQTRDAAFRQSDEFRELFFAKCRFLAGALHFDKAPIAGHDYVHIDMRVYILNVV